MRRGGGGIPERRRGIALSSVGGLSMHASQPAFGPRLATIVGLVVGALGIAVLWAGALVVGLAPWRWAPAVGVLLSLFILVGFLISPDGIPYIRGEHGAARQIGQAIEVIGVLTALIAGVIATGADYRKLARHAR